MMKRIRYFLLALSLCYTHVVLAQTNVTVIIIRHAEKDTSQPGSAMMTSDPGLSAAGQRRAENLKLALKDYHIDSIFSTNYNRTRQTVTPIAQQRNVPISIYDPRNQQALADRIKNSNNTTFLVAGHSNTVVRLVNLLTGSNDPDLADQVYDRIYFVKFTGDATTVYTEKY